jgi:uncharacterized protein
MAATRTKPKPTEATRQKVHFRSGEDNCAAWFYPGTNGACVVMAGGLAVAKEPGTDRFAERFNQAGFSVLAFDFRRLGESGGSPRQLVRVGDQQEDFLRAIEFARTLHEVDPAKVAIWGFSPATGGWAPRSRSRRSPTARPPLRTAFATPRLSPACGSRPAARSTRSVG